MPGHGMVIVVVALVTASKQLLGSVPRREPMPYCVSHYIPNQGRNPLPAHGFLLGSGEIEKGNWSPRITVRHVSSEALSPGSTVFPGTGKSFAGTR
jgi:hypothetical protein